MRQAPTLFEDLASKDGHTDAGVSDEFKYVNRLGWVPTDWKVKRLDELADLSRGKFTARPRNDPKYYGGDIPFVQTGDVATAGGWLTSYSQTLNRQGLEVSKMFPEGTILVTIAANIGSAALTTFDVAFPDSVVGLHTTQQTSGVWLLYSMQKRKARLEHLAAQSAQKNINLRVLRPQKFATLPPDEQRRIADILKSWDRAIEQVDALIEQKRERLHGLRQRLLTGEVRFPEFDEPWVDVEIGSLLKRVYRYVDWDDDATYDLVSIKRDSQGMVFRKSLKGSEIKTKTLNTLREGDFVISRMQVVHGATAYVSGEFDGMHASDSYIILVPRNEDRIDTEFFAELSKLPYLYHIAFTSSYGVHIEKMTFNPDWYLESEVHIPPTVEEQRKIVSFLNTAKAEIKKLEQKREALKRQKKGLMQRLLTGAVRTV